MPFDSTTITEVLPYSWEGGFLVLNWTASVGPPTYAFQIYINGHLAWYGIEMHATVPAPSGMIDVLIGSVLDSEITTDFSSSITPYTTRASLSWTASGAAGFHVYEGPTPGAAVDYTKLAGTVVALEQGQAPDGYDLGPYDQGGYDAQGATYGWISAPLYNGSWKFGVVPYDQAGNEGTTSEITVVISCPPRPPALDSYGHRLEYTYGATTHAVTLTWQASPG